MSKSGGAVEMIKEYFRLAVKVIKTPKVFFKEVEKEKDIKVSIKYLAFFAVFSSIAGLLMSIVVVLFTSPQTDIVANLPQALTYFVINGVILFVLNLVTGLVVHLYLKLFKGKGTLTQTIQLCIYSATPVLLFGWIILPLIVTILSLYNFYLLYIGGIQLHDLSKRRALIALIIIPVILLLSSALIPSPQY